MGRLIQPDDQRQLATVHPDLQRVVVEAVRRLPFDCFIIYGHRTTAEQQNLFALGRTRPGRRVTNIDGVTKKSRHNYTPSLAIDMGPASLIATGRWVESAAAIKQFDELGAMAEAVAKELGVADFEWGGRWARLRDRPHFQLNRKG
jgi:peptidoglycan L-alanyl-D-glutamate endopeptidase CwlK